MSTGYMIIYVGFGVLSLAVVLTVLMAVTMPSARRRMEEKLAEKY